MISSGLITDMAAIPVPDLAVPYAAPRAVIHSKYTHTVTLNLIYIGSEVILSSGT
jgi:hypothetical protein